ncbi:hypothetical protein T439DRAFT_212388 [Meredithblackwellia eburnea MCA 4105]
MSTSSSAAASSSSFHFSPPAHASPSPLHSPISPLESTLDPSPSPSSPAIPSPTSPAQQHLPSSHFSTSSEFTLPTSSFTDALAKVDGPTSIWGAPSVSQAAAAPGTRTTRASSEDQLLGRIGTARSGGAFGSNSIVGTGSRAGEDLYAFEVPDRYERRSLDSRPLFLPSSLPAPIAPSSKHAFGSPPAPLSPPSLSPAQSSSSHVPSNNSYTNQTSSPPDPPGPLSSAEPRASSSLHLGDLEPWMDEAYVRECCARMGWDGVTGVKIIRGSSPTSGYCFLTFPSVNHAAQVLARFNASPPTLMPRSSRTFKLNWSTGLPGAQPRWDGEFSVFVGDLGRDVGEAELMALFTPLFPSTKSAKIMYDPSTSLSRGYGFIRFADEGDMQRALLLGQNAGSGLSLHGRTLRISEASGPGAEGRERTRSTSRDGSTTSSYHNPLHQREISSPTSSFASHLSPTFNSPYTPSTPLSPGSLHFSSNPLSPALGASSSLSSSRSGPLSPRSGGSGFPNSLSSSVGAGNSAGPHTTDPNNTTVFVGGLPACISEETLKSFFHHFGEITYCKIPAGKGCGFVQFVRRADAELAIAKMNDFPIHGKSRIRLSWGRSQGDKQVEHVRKLANALGVPFDAVWRMVQGQDNTTIKQIASAVGSGGSSATSPTGRFEVTSGMPSRLDVAAVANAARLSEAEVLDLVGGLNKEQPHHLYQSIGAGNRADGNELFTRSSTLNASVNSRDPVPPSGNGPYSRVSPSSFSAFSSPSPVQNHLPMSPPPSAGAFGQAQQLQHQQQQQYPAHSLPSGYGPSPPYSAMRPESYHVHSPPSPYERVDFGLSGGRPQPSALSQSYGASAGARFQQQSYQQPAPFRAAEFRPLPSHGEHDPYQIVSLEESFGHLGFSSPPSPAELPQHSSNGGTRAGLFQPDTSSLTPGAKAFDESRLRNAYGSHNNSLGGGAQWGAWNDARDVQA